MKAIKAQGFTLIEMLIAIAVGAAVSILAYESLSGAISVESKVNRMTTLTTDIQRTWHFLGSDVQHAVARPWADYLGNAQPAMLGKLGDRRSQSSDVAIDVDAHVIRFVRSGDHNFLQQPRSNLQIVGYRIALSDSEELGSNDSSFDLWRDHWRPIDSDVEPKIHSLLLLSHVKEVRFRYLSKNSKSVDDQAWIDGWPESVAQRDQLPIAIEVTINVDGFGEVTRLFSIAVEG